MTAAAAGALGAELPPIDATADGAALLDQTRPLRLAVTVNGTPVAGLQPFVLTPPQRLAAQRAVIEQIGIAVGGRGTPQSLVDLGTLAEVSYRFDESAQAIAFTLPDARRQPRVYDPRDTPGPLGPRPDWGAFLNYSLFASNPEGSGRGAHETAANATLDAHLFGPAGAVEQTLLAGAVPGRRQEALRLDTRYTWLDPDRMLTVGLGDAISSGLAWTRPVRFGGVQIARDFTLQPDLVTRPLPAFAGSAAVPSTVDVLVGSTKLMSEHVDPGPFQLVNIPSLSNGVAHVVVTDASGRQSQSSLQLYDAVALLRPTLTDFSFEAGFARRSYGVLSDDYDSRPLVSATLRRGFTPTLTGEAHAEAGAGLGTGGAGLVAATPWATVELASGVSAEKGRFGATLYAGLETDLAGVTLHADMQVRTGAYNDLAGATARWSGVPVAPDATLPVGLGALRDLSSFAPPRWQSQLALSAPLPLWASTASVSLIDIKDASGTRTDLLSASLTVPLPHHASLFATAFADVSGRIGGGFVAGVSVLLGADITATAGTSSSGGGGRLAGTVTAQKALGREAGSYGWQVADLESANPVRLATAATRTGYATIGGSVLQDRQRVNASATLEGSVAAMGGAVAAGERIEDSFALVSAGLPGVVVQQDHRPVGTTDPWGHYLVTGLAADQANRIALDPLSVPARAETALTESVVTPRRASGVAVAFGGERNPRATTVILVDAAGRVLPPGSSGQVDGSGDRFVVGYNGEAYLRHLSPVNAITVETAAGACHATVAYDPGHPAGPPVRCR